MTPPRVASDVKGVWFVTVRRWLADHDEPALLRIIERMPPEHREAMREPSASLWYPEEALARALQLLREEMRATRDEPFTKLMEEITAIGLSRFFRAFLSVTSAGFAFKGVPAMWRHIRRGDGKVAVDSDAEGVTVRYTSFPRFADPNYRLLTVGSLRALLAATETAGDVQIASATDHALTIRIRYAAARGVTDR